MISVCLAARNGERFIEAQILSILRSERVSELIVSDDGSTDSTCSIVERIGDPRIRLLKGPRSGVARNFEFLLERSRGEIVFLSDQDDVWLPGKVDVMTEALQRAELVVCDCRVVDEMLQEVQPSFFALRRSGPGLLRNLVRNSYLGCCMAFRRSLLQKALPFPGAVPMHDWWLGLVAERFGSVAFVREPLVLYRRHGSNLTPTAERSTATSLQRLRWRAALAAALLARR